MTVWSWTCLHVQGKLLNITVIRICATTPDAEEAEVDRFYKDLQDLLELTAKKRCPFHHRVLKCKSRKSRDTWSNRQVWPWSTKWSGAKANRVLSREHTGYSKQPFSNNTERQLCTWTLSDGQYRNQIDYVLCSRRWRSCIQSAKTRSGADWLRSWASYCKIQA